MVKQYCLNDKNLGYKRLPLGYVNGRSVAVCLDFVREERIKKEKNID